MASGVMDIFDRQVARWSSIVGLIAGAGVVITYAGGAISQIRHFPGYFKWPLTVFAAVFVTVAVLRLVVYVRYRKHADPQATVVYGPQFAHFGGDVLGGTMEGNVMIVGESRPPAEAVSLIPSSPALLSKLADDMENLSREVHGLFERYEAPYNLDWDEHERLQEEERARDREALKDYRTDYHPRALHLYEQARSRGYPDDQLDSWTGMSVNNQHVADEISTRLRALAERIRFDLEQGKLDRSST
jgi:hypothetical protein